MNRKILATTIEVLILYLMSMALNFFLCQIIRTAKGPLWIGRTTLFYYQYLVFPIAHSYVTLAASWSLAEQRGLRPEPRTFSMKAILVATHWMLIFLGVLYVNYFIGTSNLLSSHDAEPIGAMLVFGPSVRHSAGVFWEILKRDHFFVPGYPIIAGIALTMRTLSLPYREGSN